MKTYSRVYANVNLDAIRDNVHTIETIMKDNAKIIAVLKADGYGHGALPIAEELETMDSIFGYGLATVDEAAILRKHHITKPILILGHSFEEQYHTIVEQDLRACVFKYDVAKQLSAEATKLGKIVRIHIKIDTGMNRLGFPVSEEAIEIIQRIACLPNLEIEGIFTHLVKSDDPVKIYTYDQISKFVSVVERLEEKGIQIPFKHCANSAGFLDVPEAQFDLGRIGISLYGLFTPGVESHALPLKPAMELKSMIVFLKRVKKGETISYGGHYTLPEDQMIATIPVGYGDGYPRSLSNIGYVLIRGKKAPIRGKVCMDQLMVDVTEIDGVQEGDEVTLFGEDHGAYLGVEELGELADRFSYEFICMLGKRIPRVYTKNGEIVDKIDAFE